MAGLYEFIRQTLDQLFRFTGNYGLAIIVLTLLLRVILFPLTSMSMRSTFKMQEVEVERKELEKKYKKDPEQLNRATLELWRRHKVNPFAGCLTLVPQLVIILAFIGALRGYDFGVNPGFLWVPNLSQADPFYILPVLAAVGTFVQSKLTTPPTEKSMQTMTYIFPLIILVFGLKYEAAFTLYWVASSAFSVIERYVIIRPERKKATGGA